MMMFNPPHPGEILREDYLVPLKLTVTSLAKALQVSRKNLSEIVNEHTGISPQMAIRLAKAFSTTPQFWMSLQSQYDLWQAMQQGLSDQVRTLYSEKPA
ncbi:MAG: HigA family addiction module antitoxin [Cyclobacteriaceae bacterium]